MLLILGVETGFFYMEGPSHLARWLNEGARVVETSEKKPTAKEDKRTTGDIIFLKENET